MVTLSNILDNKNIRVISEMGNVRILEHQTDLSVTHEDAMQEYYASRMNVKRRQAFIELENSSFTISPGAMQWMTGNLEVSTGIKGVGDFFGKMLASKVTNESAIKPVYKGTGYLMLEPTYKHLILLNVGEWGTVVLEDGMFYGCDSSIVQKVVSRKSLSSAALGGEGMFNLSLSGNGVAILESPVPLEELYVFDLQNDTLKIDGNMAVAWSDSLQFTVETSSKSIIGSAVNQEGLVNVYRGTGKVLMAPVGF